MNDRLLAKQALDKKDYEKAHLLFLELIKIDANNTETLLGIAESLYRLNKYADARAYVERALELETTNPEAHFILGKILFWSGDFAGSLRELGITLEKDPKNMEAHQYLGSIYANTRQYKLASEVFWNLLKNRPSFFNLFSWMTIQLKMRPYLRLLLGAGLYLILLISLGRKLLWLQGLWFFFVILYGSANYYIFKARKEVFIFIGLNLFVYAALLMVVK